MKTRILFIIGFTLICQFILHSQCPTPTLPSGTSTPLIVCENSALTITVEGLAGATYNWQVSAGGTLGTSTTNTNTFSATTAGPYTVNVTQEVTSGSNQCDPSMELVIPIIVDATPTLSAGASTNPSTCSGTNGSIQFTSTNLPNGSHTLNYKKGTSAQSTTITVSSNSFTLLSLTAGSYSDFSVTVNGCTGTFTGPVSLSDPDTPTLSAGASTNPSTCSGTNGSIQFTSTNLPNGSHTLNYKKGTSAQSTTITVSSNSFTLLSLTAGSYSDFSVTVNGCTGTFTGPVSLSDPDTPTLSAGASTNPSTCSGTNGSIQFTSTNLPNGSHTLNYKKGTSAQSTTITVSSNSFTLLSLTAGSYSDFSVTVNGCTGTFTGLVSLSDPDTPTLSAGASTNPSTCSGTNGSIQFTSTNLPNGSHTLNYKKGTSAQSTTITVSSNSFTLLSLTAGSYSDFSVTVNGCTGTFAGPVNLSDPDTPTLSAGASTNPSTCSGTNGSIQFTSTNLPNGSHTLNYKKGTSAQSTTITVSSNSFTLLSLTAGSYSDFSVTVNGCTGTFAGPVNLSDPATPTLSAGTSTNPSTCSGTNGSIQFSSTNLPNGSHTLNYKKGTSAQSTTITVSSNSFTLSSLTAGSYSDFSVTVNGCTGIFAGPVNLSDPATPTLSAGTSTNPSTCSGTNGSIQFTSTNLPNGSHTLNYKKGTSAQSTTITVSSISFTLLSLTAGSYSDFSVTVNGCTGTFAGPVNLSDPATPTLSAGTSTNPSTCSGTNGSIQFSSTNLPNGSHTLNYKKGTSEQSTTITVSNNSFTLSSLTAGTYSDFSVTVNGCSGTFAGPVNLSDPATPSQPSDITVNPTLICGIANTINASISPVNGITYNWAVSPPVQNPMNLGGNYSFNVGDTGQYTISVSASINNCTSPVRTKAITVHPLPTASITGPSSICEKASEFFTASGGVKYHWSDETIDSVIPLAGLDDGNYTFTVTVTDTNGCTDAESKDVEVKNVPTATIKIRTTNNDSELLISPNIENIQNVEVETTRYLISKGGVTILDNTLIGTNEYKATGLDIGFTYDIRLEIKYKNGCIYVVNQFYTLNSEDCNLFNPRMNEFILNNNTLELKQCNLDSFEMNFVFSGGNLTSTNLKIGDFSIIKDLDNNSVKISIKVPLKLNTNNEFEIMVIHKYGAGGSSNEPCTYNISIDNQTVPSITLDEGNFCFRKGDLKLPITKSPSNTTFSFNGGSPSEIEIGSPKYRNETFVDSIILTNIKAEGNVCKPYNKSLTYRIYRTPEIIIDSSFCLDAIVKNILEINDKDREAIWSIYDNRGKIDTLQSGINLDSSDTLRVSGYLVHSGGPTCYTDTVTKNIIVKPLPSAKISSYTKDCGPFYKVDSLSTVTNQNARYTWKLGNDTTGILNIFNNKQIIGVTGSGILSLTQEKDGCYDHDTIAIKNSTNFTLSPDTILYRACNTDTLYYLRNFKDRDCYRWMYINPDGDIKELTDVDKPYVKLNNKNQPLLIVYGCNEPCTGTVVTNRSSGADHDCSEDMSKQDKPIEIRPNPAYDLVELYSNFKHKGKYDIYVNDITGRRIVHFVMLHDGGSFTLPFDVSGWQSGLYFVSIGSETKKLIVIK